jgi:hypothetical protein
VTLFMAPAGVELLGEFFAASMRWSCGRPARRALAVATALACVTCLAACWMAQGQFRGW